nr:DUF4166 domain-containing protein [Panacagrimonas sp.]
MTAVQRWFGDAFVTLHPRLQELHSRGGRLRGEVEITIGKGLAGWIGGRVARAIGLPIERTRDTFEVEIRHVDDALSWTRRFGHGVEMQSLFVPVGTWPGGYWYEKTHGLQMWMSVDTPDGAWQWKPLRAHLRGVRLPLCLLPESRAGKRIAGDEYVFWVEFVVPLIGEVLSYRGTLSIV